MSKAKLWNVRLLRILTVLPLCIGSAQSSAQPRPFAVVDGAFFALSVPDLDAAVAWYTSRLGLAVRSSFSYGTMRGTILEGDGLAVELIANPDAVSPRDPMDVEGKVLVRGITKAGVRVRDFDRAIGTLRERGVPILMGPFPPKKDQRANAIIRDVAGNLIQILGDYAR